MKKQEQQQENSEAESVKQAKEKRMPQHAIDKVNRALEAGKTPSEMEDATYRKMFE
jgi:transcriptional/translational regulatory protein YebC/TACO1